MGLPLLVAAVPVLAFAGSPLIAIAGALLWGAAAALPPSTSRRWSHGRCTVTHPDTPEDDPATEVLAKIAIKNHASEEATLSGQPGGTALLGVSQQLRVIGDIDMSIRCSLRMSLKTSLIER